jgi:hypothetical protein
VRARGGAVLPRAASRGDGLEGLAKTDDDNITRRPASFLRLEVCRR